MPYERSQMLYDNGTYYKWKAREDRDNPFYKNGADHSELNKTEGYEVLYFINHLAKKWIWRNQQREILKEPGLSSYQKMEKLIREAPSRSTHAKVASFILDNW